MFNQFEIILIKSTDPYILHPLVSHIKRITGQLPSHEDELIAYFELVEAKKKQVLLEEGHFCKHLYFVISGCLRLYFTDKNGTEQTIQFALENWWLTDPDNFKKGAHSHYAIQALENTELLCITHTQLQHLLNRHPIMDSYFRLIFERAYSAMLWRVRLNYQMQKKEFYETFASSYPEFVQRIPQKILASFLGFTPEYLSEMRKDIARSKKQPR